MTQYVLQPSNFQPGMVGQNYHLGLSDGTASYGYVLQNRGGTDERSAVNETSDINSRDRLIQVSSPSLIDQHLVNYPRVSQGDYSGGGLQVVFIDASKYFDSDLDVKTPGYLQLRPSWARVTKTIASPGSYTQAIAWRGDIWFTFNESGGNIYSLNGGTTLNPGFAVRGLDTDGVNLWMGGSGALSFSNDGSTTSAAATSLNGTALKWWVLNQGTTGRFVYYAVAGSGLDLLYKFSTDPSVNSFPVGTGSQAQVPTANNVFRIVDLVAYQNGIAILTTDSTSTNGFDVWYHDGANLTRIVRVEGYVGKGMCSALGDLYVGAQAANLNDSPVLARITSGQYEIVARPGEPGIYSAQYCGQPRSGAEFVYWPVQLAGQGISTAPYVLVFDTFSGAISHLPNFDGTDWGTTLTSDHYAVHRNVAPYGRGVSFAWQASSTSGVAQAQTTIKAPFSYMASGWMVSSKYDFGTPGIPKRNRRIEIHHTPLNAGEQVLVRAFIDQDPLAFTTALAPVPSTATVANSTVGSIVTVLTMGSDQSIGRSMYFAYQLTAGTGQATTPKVIYTAVEIGGTWIWDFDLDCTSARRLLNQATEDSQGVTGKDLYFLLRNAYENGTPLTLYLSGLSYTVNVESLKGQAWGYVQHQGAPVKADEEWLVHVTLRQEAS